MPLRDLNNANDRYLGPLNTGMLGSTIATTGDDGPGVLGYLLIQDASLGTKELRIKIIRLPTSGTLVVYEDGSFTYERTGDGTDYFECQPYINGVPTAEIVRITMTIGSGNLKTYVLRNISFLRAIGF